MTFEYRWLLNIFGIRTGPLDFLLDVPVSISDMVIVTFAGNKRQLKGAITLQSHQDVNSSDSYQPVLYDCSSQCI